MPTRKAKAKREEMVLIEMSGKALSLFQSQSNVRLTLKQHGCELHGSTYTQRFFSINILYLYLEISDNLNTLIEKPHSFVIARQLRKS